MKKRILAIAMTLCMTIACTAPAFAAEGVKQTKVLVNNFALENVSADSPEGSAACVPARAVFEALGCKVEWVPDGNPSVVVSDMMGRKVLGYNLGDDIATRYLMNGSTEEIMLMAPVYANAGWVTMINGYAIANALNIPIYEEGESDASKIDTMFHYDADGNVCYPVFMPAV